MLIYFDTSNLINITEREDPCDILGLRRLLMAGQHRLVLSMNTILELSEPLLNRHASTNVTALLNRLESLPHVFVNASRISKLELEQAVKAFFEGKEYEFVTPPFVARFDETVDLNAKPPTRVFLNYSLAETIWDLFNVGALAHQEIFPVKLKEAFALDRNGSPKPTLRQHFRTVIKRKLAMNRIGVLDGEADALADWIYATPSRCPAIRLGYELWHKMIKNVGDQPRASDIEDFHHLDCAPYVDMITMDRRMHGYLMQVGVSIGVDYGSKAFRETTDVLKKIHSYNESVHWIEYFPQ